jgi:tight adherence protein C
MLLPSVTTLLMALGAAGVAALLAVLAAGLLANAAEDKDLGSRMRAVVRPPVPAVAVRPRGGGAGGLLRPVQRLGEALRDSAFVSAKDLAEFQRAMVATGLDPRRAVPVFLGVKALLLLLLPLAAFVLSVLLQTDDTQTGMLLAGSLVIAVFAPNWALDLLRRPFQSRLRKGLPDALDLLVVATEAGLGLETALDRVARDMVGSNRAIALELGILVQELRMLPDRWEAFERLAERTQLDGFRRLGSTLVQTMRYGTPLAQSLRTLSAEMRAERLLRLEEKALRLPVLLVAPLILFILPSLFIALIGPSILELMKSFGAVS